MIAWLHPVALLALAAIAAPVLVHLLLRQRAKRIVVPSVRFIPGRDESAARLRRPSDPWLLLLRILIVACAALAVSRPLVVTDTRREAWQARRVVAIIAPAVASGAMDEAIRAAQTGTHASSVIRSVRLGAALDRAGAWLLESPPATREIVVLSDFRRGAVSAFDLVRVPPGIGLRFVRTDDGAPPQTGHRDAVLTGGARREQITTVEGERTIVRFSPATSAAADGVRFLLDPADASHAATLTRVVARAGVFAPSAERSIAVRFRGGAPLAGAERRPNPWTFGAAARLLEWSRDAGIPISVVAAGEELAVDADVPASTPEAAEILRAALHARWDPNELRELETERISDEELQAWTREPAPPDPDAWRQSDDSDGRWLWGVALVLLAAEGLTRRRGQSLNLARPATLDDSTEQNAHVT